MIFAVMKTRKEIKEFGFGCAYCAYFDRCYTAEWRDGNTCDLFALDRDKK